MVIGIRFRPNGQLYYFSSDMPLSEGNAVVVATEQGTGFGHVAIVLEHPPSDLQDITLSPIMRIASAEDCQIALDNVQMSKQAFTFCKKCIEDRALEMKLVDVEIFFDQSKFIFYFTAPLRIDFRELVKDLVREYHARIELRQIGVRHETQMIGAVGPCGMMCCCRRYLRKFAPVTIRMAKEQSLFLNPVKISGICGRLLCCLSFEQENYDNFHNACPKLGKKYQTKQGSLRVLRSNMFRNSISVLNEKNEEIELTLEQWQEICPNYQEMNSGQKSKASKKASSNDDGLLVVTMDNFDDDAFAYTEDPYASVMPKKSNIYNTKTQDYDKGKNTLKDMENPKKEPHWQSKRNSQSKNDGGFSGLAPKNKK